MSKQAIRKENTVFYIFFFLWRCCPTWARASSFLRFLDHTQRRIIVDRTPLDVYSFRRRDLCLTIHNTHNDKTIHTTGGIRKYNLRRRAAANPRLRQRGYCDRHCFSKFHKPSALKNTHRKVCIPTPSQLPWRALNFFAHQKRKDITESKLNSLVRRIELYALT